MKTLGASIVQRGVASVGDVEKALARQVMYGGDLATNLLELASVSEEKLTELLAMSHGMDPAPPGELPVANDAVRRLVPGDLAFRHGLYPLSEQAGTLTVAVAEPLALEVEQDLSFAFGVNIVQVASPLVRIHQAVARDYHLPLDKRTDRIIAKLTGHPASLSEPPRPDFSSLPRPETLPPSAYASDAAIDMEAPTAPPPQVYPFIGLSADQHREATHAAPIPESAGRPPIAVERDGTPQAVPVAIARETGGISETSTQETPGRRPRVDTRALTTAARELVRESLPAEARQHRRLGPYTVADAERDLMSAQDRDDVLNAFFDFASQYFEYCALFVMHNDLAEGRDARGPGATREEVRTLGIVLDLPSAIASVNERRKWQLVRLTGGGIDTGLAKDLKRQSGPQCLLLPIVMRQRSVLILYGDHGHTDVRLADVGDVISFAPLVASGLERVILKRKGGATKTSGLPLPNLPVRRSQAPLPTQEDRARALASVLDAHTDQPKTPAGGFAESKPAPAVQKLPRKAVAHSPSTLRASTPALPYGRPDDAKTATSKNGPAPPPSVAPTRQSAASPGPHPGSPFLPASRRASGQGLSSPPRTVPSGQVRGPLAEQVVTKGDHRPPTASAQDPAGEPANQNVDGSVSPELEDDSRTSVIPQRVLSIEPPPHPTDNLSRTQLSPGAEMPPAPFSARPIAPSFGPDSAEEPPEDGWDIESRRSNLRAGPSPAQSADAVPAGPDILVGTSELGREFSDALAREQTVPLAPASRSVSYSARPPNPRQSSEELRLPSVIVDFESDCRALVQRLCSGDAEAGEKLVEMGPSAVSALVAAFPGPIQHELGRGGEGPHKASDCGPVLRTLVRIGPAAVPFIVVRTADTQPGVRAWATRILGELPTRESAYAVARRLVDDNQEVRRAALAAARMHQREPQAQAAVREYLADLVCDTSRSSDARHAALEALTDIRDADAVPLLIRIMGDSNRELVKSAHWGLAVLTRTDLGNDARPWEKWWRNNAGRHRVEWLIDSLMHENADIRRAAGDELKNITKEYFGYYDDLPRKERAAAQARYLQWWESKGRVRFH